MSLWGLFDFNLCGCTTDKNENWKNPPACCWDVGIPGILYSSFVYSALLFWSSVACQAWWQFLSSEFVSLFPAPIWTVLLAACPWISAGWGCSSHVMSRESGLPPSCSWTTGYQGWYILLFLLKGRSSHGRIPHIPGGALEVMDTVFWPVLSLSPSSMLTNSSPPASPEHPIV